MNLHDETLLSAYLDDELGASGRAEVEAALLANPDLRLRLADLAGIRDVLGGLSRPSAPPHLASMVQTRLARQRPRRVGLLVAAGLTSLAACLVVARVGSLPTRREAVMVAQKSSTPAPPPADHSPIRRMSKTEVTPASPAPLLARRAPESRNRLKPAADSARLHSAPAASAKPVELSVTSRPVPYAGEASKTAAGMDSPDQAELRRLLTRPDVVRLTVTVDVLDDASVATMNGLVENLHKKRPDWGQLRVEQTVVIDPARPGRAVIYAMVLDQPERQRLDRSLHESFPDRVRQDRPVPAVMTCLGEPVQVGKFTLHQGQAVAGLLPENVIRDHSIMHFKAERDAAAPLGPDADGPTAQAESPQDRTLTNNAQSEATAPRPAVRPMPEILARGNSKDNADKAKTRLDDSRQAPPSPLREELSDDRTSTILVWMTAARPGG